ncbi:MAG: pitrilysin family protein, partial [Gemmatimonadota bacterium]
VRLMAWSWATLAMTGCAASMSSSSDPETGTRSVTVGATVGGGGSASQTGVDRSRAPGVGAPEALELPEVQDFTSSNGMRIVMVERSALPLVSLELQFRGGAAAHAPAKAGLAAITADMIDEGTRTRSALEIADEVDLLGASLSSSAGYDASRIRMSVLRSHLPEALEILGDIVAHPTFPEAELERLRRERLARIIQRSDVPAALADDAFNAVLYGPDHPYGVPLLGTQTSVETLSRDDVVAYHAARYAPGQATLVVAGDVTREDLEELLGDTFADWSGAGEDPSPLPEVQARTDRVIYLVDKPGAAQSEVRVGRVAVDRRSGLYYPLQVLNTVLGGSFTSRLNMKLREEKGYTYGAGSAFDMRRVPGPFAAAAAVATPVTDSAVVDFVREIDRLAEEAVPEEELVRARNYLALRLPQRFETLGDVVRRLSELVLYAIPLEFYEGYVDGVTAVDAAAVLDVAAAQLGTRRMAIVIAGDRSVIEEPLEALGLGSVVVLDAASPSPQE